MKKLWTCMSVFALLSAWAGNEKTTSALVVPQDVSWSLKQIGLTRSLEGVSGGNKTVRNQTQNLTSSENFKETSSKNAERGASKESSRGWSAEGKASAGVKWGVVPTASAEGSVGGKTSNENSDRSKETSATGSASAKEQLQQNVDGSTSEGLEEERYGGYCLKFALALKSNNPADSFRVCATNAKIRLQGLTVPVVIPCDHGEFTLGAEEMILDFVFPIKDQTLLRELVSVAVQGAWQKLSVELVGYEFPVMSAASGKNVITEMRVAEQNSPTTEFAVEFGDVARISPWRVKQRYGRSSGKRGKLVTVRDAMLAINEVVGQNDEMPERMFEIGKNGTLASVCDVPFVQKPTAKNLGMIGVRVDGDDDAMKVHPPTLDFMDLPIRNFRRIEFLSVEMSDVAEAVKINENLNSLRAEVASFADSVGASNVWHDLVGEDVAPKRNEDVAQKSNVEVAKVGSSSLTGSCVIFGESESLLGADFDVSVNGYFRGTVKAKSRLCLDGIKEGDELTVASDLFGLAKVPMCKYKIRREMYDLRLLASGKIQEIREPEK